MYARDIERLRQEAVGGIDVTGVPPTSNWPLAYAVRRIGEMIDADLGRGAHQELFVDDPT